MKSGPPEVFIRGFPEPDRRDAELAAAAAVTERPEDFLARYEADPRSFGGRYISADLIKETFALYAESPASRARYNNPIHNAAAVLSALQYELRVRAAAAGQVALFITGIPGAGKTSSVLQTFRDLPDEVALVFEGQLSRPETGIEKIAGALRHGLRPVILAIHADPEAALERTLQRFGEIGRGASLNVMAEIQGGLPDGLKVIHDRFGDQVTLRVRDQRQMEKAVEYSGWNHIERLKSEGSRRDVKLRLEAHLAALHGAGRVSPAAFRQAAGAPAPSEPGPVVGGIGGDHSKDLREPGPSSGSGQVPQLSQSPTSSDSHPSEATFKY